MKVTILEKSSKEDYSFSASQVKQFRTCKLCWAAQKINGLQRPPGPAAVKGTQIHKIIETYLETGKFPDSKLLEIARCGMPFWPKPGSAQLEKSIIFDIDGIKFRGFIDLLYRKDDLWIVADHKTTSSFTYALTRPELLSDVQANLYALWAMQNYNVDKVALNWIYYRTRGKAEAKLMSAETTKDRVEKEIEGVLKDCREMLQAIADGKSAKDFSPPISGCKSFGGCFAKELGLNFQKKDFTLFLTEKTTADILKEENGEVPLKKSNFELLIGCCPMKGDEKVIQLVDLLAPVFEQVANEFGVLHYKLVEYGKGPGALAVALDKYLTENPLTNGEVVVMPKASAEGTDVVNVLIRHATRVRG